MSPEEFEFAILAGIVILMAGIVGGVLRHYGKMSPIIFVAIMASAGFIMAIGGGLMGGASAKQITPLFVLGSVGAALLYSSNTTRHNS